MYGILVGAMMILSVYLPHSGFDEEDHFATLEAVRNIMDEEKKLGAVDFFIGGDINIELKLEPGDEDLQGLDGIDWYGIYGPKCEDVVTYEKKLWWPQLLRDFDCTVTSTWVDAENLAECHTWRAWGSRVRKKQLDYVMVPRDLVVKTWYLNKTRIRTWDHYPVVVKIEGREMRVRKGKKEWAGLDPSIGRCGEDIPRTMSLSRRSRSWCDANEVSGLESFAGETGRCCRGGQGYYVGVQEQEQVYGAR